jgi:hypothetical protein
MRKVLSILLLDLELLKKQDTYNNENNPNWNAY